MNNQMRSELRKLFTTRTVWWLALGVVGMALLATSSVSGQSAAEYAKPLADQQFFFVNMFSRLLLLVLGIRMVTDEFRYGTAVPTFISSPNRTRVIVSKVLVAGVAGMAIAALGQAAMVGSATAVFSMNGHDLEIGTRGLQGIVGGVLAGGIWAVIGVGLGALIRNQVVAIVGSFVWLMAIEEIVRARLGDTLGGFLPGQAGGTLALAPEEYWAAGAAIFLAYGVIATALGLVWTRLRDIA